MIHSWKWAGKLPLLFSIQDAVAAGWKWFKCRKVRNIRVYFAAFFSPFLRSPGGSSILFNQRWKSIGELQQCHLAVTPLTSGRFKARRADWLNGARGRRVIISDVEIGLSSNQCRRINAPVTNAIAVSIQQQLYVYSSCTIWKATGI